MRLLPTHLLLALMLPAAAAFAQSTAAEQVQPMAPNAHPAFAVATIKPHDSNDNTPCHFCQGFNTEGRRITIRKESITSLLVFAYAIHKRQIANLPPWASETAYDIDGTTDTPGEPSLRQYQEMIQKLLADRFSLNFHREKRNLPVYAIVIAKGGLKLKPAANPTAEPDQEGNGHGNEQTLTYTSADIANFILGEQFFMDRPLVDQTHLTGRYDFILHYTRDDDASTDPNAPPGIFTAIQEQLGLKFQPTKAPIDVLVIDHIAPPTPN